MVTFAWPHLWVCEMVLFVVHLSFDFQGYRYYSWVTIITNIILVYNWQRRPTCPVSELRTAMSTTRTVFASVHLNHQYSAWRYHKMSSSILITRVLAGLRDRSNFLWVINLHRLNQPSLMNRKYIPWHRNLFQQAIPSLFWQCFFLIAYLVSFKAELNCRHSNM